MRAAWPITACIGLASCSSLPPTHDPERCDRFAESAKQSGSDLVVDGDLYCATSISDCELTLAKIVSSKIAGIESKSTIPVRILREEADAFGRELSDRGEIAFCYPDELWSPGQGHHRGRFYLRAQPDGKFRFAYRPRTRS